MCRYKLFLIGFLFLFGCRNNEQIDSDLSHADKLMWANPDSSLCIIERIDPDLIPQRSIRAKYALLYSQALDKNYVDETNDSLVRIAANYYEKHGSVREKFLSLYYLGRVQYNSGSYAQAMFSYIEAESHLKSLGDDYLAGLLYTQIADIHSKYFDYRSCLHAAQKAYAHYARTDLTAHRNYALSDVGTAYFYLNEFDKSEETFIEVVTAAKQSNDTTLLAEGLSALALIYLDENQTPRAKELFLKVSNELHYPFRQVELGAMAYIYALENKADSSDLYLKTALQSASNKLDSINIGLRDYQIEKQRRNYPEALSKLEWCMQSQDSAVRQTLRQSVVAAQRDFFQEQSEYAAYRLKSNTNMLLLMTAFLIFIIVSIVLYLHRRLQMKNLLIAKYLNMAGDVEQTMHLHDAEMAELVQHLFREKFELIDQLSCTYYERQNTPTEQSAIYTQVKEAILELGNNRQTKTALEEIVNKCRHNVMAKLREQMPQIKEADYELLCYLFAGFSYRTISIFTQDKIENIYTRKFRLKSRIQSSEASDKQIFLDMLA